MKNLYKLSAILFVMLVAFSCKDDELPAPTANFSIDPLVPEVGVPIMFENLTINAASYIWDFGDGSSPSGEISPTHTFEEAGTYNVTLTATTQDGQSVVASQNILIKERVLLSITVNTFPVKNGEDHWDPTETNPDSVYADVLLLFGNDNDGYLYTLPIAELNEAPFGANFSSANIILTNEDWFFGLYDFDGADIDNPDFDNFDTEFEPMIEIGFNPIVDFPVVRLEDGNEGYFYVSGEDQNGNYINVRFYFELQ